MTAQTFPTQREVRITFTDNNGNAAFEDIDLNPPEFQESLYREMALLPDGNAKQISFLSDLTNDARQINMILANAINVPDQDISLVRTKVEQMQSFVKRMEIEKNQRLEWSAEWLNAESLSDQITAHPRDEQGLDSLVDWMEKNLRVQSRLYRMPEAKTGTKRHAATLMMDALDGKSPKEQLSWFKNNLSKASLKQLGLLDAPQITTEDTPPKNQNASAPVQPSFSVQNITSLSTKLNSMRHYSLFWWLRNNLTTKGFFAIFDAPKKEATNVFFGEDMNASDVIWNKLFTLPTADATKTPADIHAWAKESFKARAYRTYVEPKMTAFQKASKIITNNRHQIVRFGVGALVGAGVRSIAQLGILFGVIAAPVGIIPLLATAAVTGAVSGAFSRAAVEIVTRKEKKFDKALLKKSLQGAAFGAIGGIVGAGLMHALYAADFWGDQAHTLASSAQPTPTTVTTPSASIQTPVTPDVPTPSLPPIVTLEPAPTVVPELPLDNIQINLAPTMKIDLSPDMMASLPDAIEKLASSSDPAKVIHFAKEASFELINGKNHSPESIKAGYKLIQEAVAYGDKLGIAPGTSQTFSQLMADQAYAQYWGIGGIAKDQTSALDLARRSGTKYGKKLLSYVAQHAKSALKPG